MVEQCERQEQASGMRSPGMASSSHYKTVVGGTIHPNEGKRTPAYGVAQHDMVRAWLREFFSFSGFTFLPGLASLLHSNICILFLGGL